MAVSARPHILQSIHQPQISVAIWQRTLPDSIAEAMARQQAMMPCQASFTLAAEAPADQAVDQALCDYGSVAGSSCCAWREDLLQLLSLARRLVPRCALRARLETKSSNGCSLLHVDQVALRLICTYRGQGTQWIGDDACDRRGLGRGNNDHVRDWSALREIPCGAVAVMKGNLYPGPRGRALMHRSPPTTPLQPRVLAVVDLIFP